MLRRVIFLIEAKEKDKAGITTRFGALSAALRTYTQTNADGVASELLLLSKKEKKDAQSVIRAADDPATTLFLSNRPQLVEALREAGAYAAGLIEGHATERDFPGTRFLFAEFDLVEPDSYEKAYQRLAKEPWTILTTARCIVRETTVEDVDAFYDIYADERITRFMEGLFEDRADERRYTADYIDNVYALMGFGVWTVLEKETKRVIGRAGFSMRNGFLETEIGFLFAVPFQRQGYATEVLRAMLDYGRDVLLLDKVQALVKEENAVSIHLLKNLGFEPMTEVRIEENIYGDDYTELRSGGLSDIKYGNYLRMMKTF